MLSLLQAQHLWAGPELAERLGVSARTLRRDIDRLRELGYPVQAAPGMDGGYRLAAGASLPPLALDDDEAVAIAVGLQGATGSAVASLAEPSLRALAKIAEVLPARLRRQVESLRAMTVTASWEENTAGPDAGILLTAAKACRADERLAMSYTAADGTRSERRIEPHRLVSLGRRWYLVAYDIDRSDWRSFRLDRVDAMSQNGRRFRQRELPSADAATFVRSNIRTARKKYDVGALLHCPADTARQRLGPRFEIDELPGERCRLSMCTESLEWAALAIGTAAVEVSDVRPAELIDVLAEWSARFARATRNRAVSPGD